MQSLYKNRKNRQWIGFGMMTLFLIAAVIFAWILKTKTSDISFQEGQCGFSKTFHLYCPGCGGTRAVKHLLDLEVIPSLLSNPIPVYAIALVIRIWVAMLHNAVSSALRKNQGVKQGTELHDGQKGAEPKKWRLLYQWEMWAILVVVIGFFVLRNVALAAFGWDYLGDMAGYW